MDGERRASGLQKTWGGVNMTEWESETTKKAAPHGRDGTSDKEWKNAWKSVDEITLIKGEKSNQTTVKKKRSGHDNDLPTSYKRGQNGGVETAGDGHLSDL